MSYKPFVLLAALALAATGISHAADAPKWVEGENYVRLDSPLPTQDADKVDVTEVFSFACPHCAHFQPFAKKLRAALPDGAVYHYKPAVFHKSWEPFARAYLTAESLGVANEKSSQALFDALHRDHRPIRSLQDLAKFYAHFGADPETFVGTAQSFVIGNQLKQDLNWERKAGVRGTPSIIVDGKYRVDANKVDGFEQMVQLTEWLVNKELAARAKEQ